MALKGFFAELHRQAKRAARENDRAQKASQRAYAAAFRAAEAAEKREAKAILAEEAAERREADAHARAHRRDHARAHKESLLELNRLKKEAQQSHEAAMMAKVECMNLKLAQIEDDLEGILIATLGVDDYVDLNTLRVRAVHPPFHHQDLLENSIPQVPIIDDPMPAPPDLSAPRGIMSIFRKRAYERAKSDALAKHESDLIKWQISLTENQTRRETEAAAYEVREQRRLASLQMEKDRYAVDCAQREEEAAEQNRAVDDLITNLGYGATEAIEEYIGIVLSNAVYPDHFPIQCSFLFDPSMAELRLCVAVITPDQLETVKSYKYSKSSDEITPIQMSAKACKDRYSNAINQVALRVPHEVFEADRRSLIKSISIEVGTHANNPATGLAGFIPLVALGVERDTFMRLDLANVQPSASLAHLGASVSKNPYGLVPANTLGVRRS